MRSFSRLAACDFAFFWDLAVKPFWFSCHCSPPMDPDKRPTGRLNRLHTLTLTVTVLLHRYADTVLQQHPMRQQFGILRWPCQSGGSVSRP